MFGESRMELDPEERRLLPNDADIGQFTFWTIITLVLKS